MGAQQLLLRGRQMLNLLRSKNLVTMAEAFDSDAGLVGKTDHG